MIAGAATPGGPVVGFSIGAVALKVGGGTPQVIAYVVAWALFAFQRMILWEVPFMPARFVLVSRGGVAAVSVPGGGDRDGDREAVSRAAGWIAFKPLKIKIFILVNDRRGRAVSEGCEFW